MIYFAAPYGLREQLGGFSKPSTTDPVVHFRHGGGFANAVFVDGHVEGFSRKFRKGPWTTMVKWFRWNSKSLGSSAMEIPQMRRSRCVVGPKLTMHSRSSYER